MAYAHDLFILQDKKCALTGVSLLMSPSLKAGANTASLDRIDSTKGYIPGNVQWVHVEINNMKSNYQESEFVSWCRLVADRSRKF